MKQLNTIHQWALAMAAIVLAVVYFLLSPLVAEWNVSWRVVAALASALGLDLLVNGIERVLVWFHVRKFLGDWYYTSEGKRGELDEGGGPVQHFAWANFSLEYPNTIRYTVRIWDRDGIESAFHNPGSAGSQLLGSAESSSVIFDGGDILEVIYKYRPLGRDGLSGFLRITGVQGGEEMTGEWVTLWRNPGSGTLRMFRRSRFEECVLSLPTGLDTQ